MRHRFGLVFTLAAAITFAGATTSRADTFSPGSLIIPMDECYQYNGSSQYTRQGWNAGQLYSTTYSGATACVQLDNTTTPASTADPYDGRCWAGSGYPAATTGLQHAY